MNILEMDLGPLVPHHSIEIIVGIILLLLLTWLIAKAVVPRPGALSSSPVGLTTRS